MTNESNNRINFNDSRRSHSDEKLGQSEGPPRVRRIPMAIDILGIEFRSKIRAISQLERGSNASLALVLAALGPPGPPFPLGSLSAGSTTRHPTVGPPTTLSESRHRGEAAGKKRRGKVSHQGPTTTTGPGSTSPLPGRPPREHDYAEIKLGSLLCRVEIRHRSLRGVEGATVSVGLFRITGSGDFEACSLPDLDSTERHKSEELSRNRAVFRG